MVHRICYYRGFVFYWMGVMNPLFMSLLLMVLIGPFSKEALASSFYCSDKIVSPGQSPREVETICGPPAFIDEYQEEKTIQKYEKIRKKIENDSTRRQRRQENIDNPPTRLSQDREMVRNLNDYLLVNESTFDITIEEWTYNFGPERFIRTLIFENDELSSIETGGYGFDAGRNDNPIVDIGDSKAVVYMKYGSPTHTDIRKQSQTSIHYNDQGECLYVEKCAKWMNIEEWTYDFGPDRLIQKLRFKNNRLVDFDS